MLAILSWIALLTLLIPSWAWAWADHFAITSAALKPLQSLANVEVPYTDFATLARDLGDGTPTRFNERILISKNYRFAPRLGEKAGKPVSVLRVLAKYSDEPDWGMDMEIFREYPQLWDPSYSMMGGKEGLPSQSFRHMYWQALDFRHPIKTFKLPLGKEFESMGEAPQRAALFITLSREAKIKGDEYWSVRFLANALHYLEDCSQPFHTVQVPTKEFLFFPLISRYGHGFSRYVAQMTNIVAYYHYSFEDYVSELMVGAEAGDGNIPGNEFVTDLQSVVHGPETLSYRDNDMEKLVREIAALGVRESALAGRSSILFFPPIQEDFLVMDPRFIDHKEGVDFAPGHVTGFEDDRWWKETREAGSVSSRGRNQYFAVVRNMFGPLGYAVRKAVRAELAWLAPGKKAEE